MATPATVNPFNHYVGLDGLPLENGYIWFGEPFQDPELQPLAAYWDDANAQPAAQPIRTVAGYPARNGAPAMVFVGAQYSMRVRDRNGRQVFYAPNVTAVDLGGGGLDVITASGGQTIVTLTNAGYTPGSNALDVYLNGIRQVSGQDYFETGTLQITMAAALSAGDQLIAFARSTFGLTQAVLSDWQAQVFNGAGGASQNFVLLRNPGAVANMDVSVTIGGIGSTLRPLIEYTLSGNTVTITPAPAVGTNNVLIRYGRSLPQDALRGELADTTSASNGDALIAVKLEAAGAADRTQHAKNTDLQTVADFRQPGDTDDTESVERSIAHLGRAHFPLRSTAYTIRRTIRATTAVQVTQDPGVLIQAASGFTGIDVTKDGSPYTLKAMFAVFVGSTINTTSGGRIGETGLSPRIDVELDCAGHAEVGIYAERCPGIRIESSVKNCVDGIFIGPYCWGAQITHPKILSFTGNGLELGFGSNGSHVDTPEIWGYTVEGTAGIVCRGNNNGFTVDGGYIEGVVDGFMATQETGAVDISGVDFEVISGNCIRAVQTGGETRSDGPITVTGCYLDSTKEEIHNTGARIISKGNRYRDPYAATGSHFYSANAKSVILSEGDSFDTTSGTAISPGTGGTNSLLMTYADGAATTITNKKTVNTSGSFYVDWGLYNYSSGQTSTLSSSLEFMNSRQGGATNVYAAQSTWTVNETETTAGPVDVVKTTAAVQLSVVGSTRVFAPTSDNNMLLGNASVRWQVVYAGTGTINTSDERLKQQIEAVPDAWLDAWADVQWSRFKFRDAVAAKDERARWHVGLIAQRVKEAFEAHELDAHAIGLLCHDQTEDGDIYGIRYEEALAMECALLRRRLAEL